MDIPECLSLSSEEFIKRTVKSRKAFGLVVPLSGGLDSSVTAVLAANALGSENVHAYTTYDGAEKDSDDVRDAISIANKTKINHRLVDISGMLDELEEGAPNAEQRAYSTGEIRTMLSYRKARETNSVVACCANKTEKLLGIFNNPYANGGDIFPLVDLYKTEVRMLARHIGVPEEIVKKPSRGGPPEIPTEEILGCSFEIIDRILYKIAEMSEPPEIAAKELGCSTCLTESIKDKVEKASKKLDFPYFQASFLLDRETFY